jgi:hypothetical protein
MAKRRSARTSRDAALREQLARLLDWSDAHVDFDRAIGDIPVGLRGRRARGLGRSPWELLEHLRLCQRDILEFCVDPRYRERTWPDDYWPKTAAPPGPRAWTGSIAAFRRDRAAMQALARTPALDLFARIPHGSGQTVLRELVLLADHNAYHVGQIVLVRRALGCWAD